MSERVNILIADDHPVVRKGLRLLLASEPSLKVVGEAADGVEAIELYEKHQPGVLLLDLQMPRKNGLDVIRKLRQDFPKARILVLTSFSDDEKVFAAIKAGAIGYLMKDATPEAIVQSIHDVDQGRPSLHPDIAYKLMRELNRPAPDLPPTDDPLTTREVDILRLVAKGLSNQQIADRLVISERTVRTHISHILDKLHLANRTQATLYALRRGFTTLDDASAE